MPIGAARSASVFGSRPLKVARITGGQQPICYFKVTTDASTRGTGMRRNTGRLGVVTFVEAGCFVRCSRLHTGGAGLRRLGPPVALGRCAVFLIGIAFTWLPMPGPISAAEIGDA